MITTDDYPRSMRDAGVRERRKAMLGHPHVAALTTYAAKLREHGVAEVPDFDPFDGGVHASALFLFEKPGPMTSEARGGSGFVSRNNDDPTVEATFRFMQEVGIPRERTITWNVVPWWNSTVQLTERELIAGATCLNNLVALLPKLRVVMLVGNQAATRARPHLQDYAHIALLTSAHPSPRVRATRRDLWDNIPQKWTEVRKFI